MAAYNSRITHYKHEIKIKAKLIEEEAKRKEKLLSALGGANKNPELGANVSNLLVDAIKAKITILENIY
jgi:hypothetical protein